MSTVCAGWAGPAAASWTTQLADATPVDARGRPVKDAPTAGPPGKIATVVGTLHDGDMFRATCDEKGTAVFAYVQPGRWIPVLADVDFTLTVKADGAHPVTLTARPRRLSDDLVAYVNDKDEDAIEAVLQNFVDALRTIELDVEAKGYGVKWTNVASALNSTVTTQRFARACGIDLLPFGQRRAGR